MIIHKKPEKALAVKNAVVTIGSFDGVHFGHRAIIDSLKAKAEETGGETVIVTLFPHPRKVLNLDTANFRLLNSLEEKEFLIERCGVGHLVELEFTEAFSRISYEDFVKEVLVGQLHAKAVVVGYNHHFGHNRDGNFQKLQRLGLQAGFDVIEIPKHDIDKEKISSTTIRAALQRGDIETANKFLEYPYFFFSPIDTEGFLQITESLKLVPPKGKYQVEIVDDYRKKERGAEAIVEIGEDERVKVVSPLWENFVEKEYMQIKFVGRI